MNARKKQERFVVAYNLMSSADSQILARGVSQAQAIKIAADKERANLYTGQGIVLYLCQAIESLESATDFAFALETNGRSTIFEVVKILRVFPRIEGALVPGIYEFCQQDSLFYEIRDAAALSRFWNNDPNFDFETEKLVCRADGIAVFGLHEQVQSKTSAKLFVKPFPFDYFDVFCPLCKARVITYQADQECLLCEIVETPCRHFVGNLVCIGDCFITEEFNDLNRRHELRRGKLHFAVGSDQWQEALVQALSGAERQTFWASDDGSDYQNRQVFLP